MGFGAGAAYKKVRKEGGARVLALTPWLPDDWEVVRISQVKSMAYKEGEEIILQIVRVSTHAQAKVYHQKGG